MSRNPQAYADDQTEGQVSPEKLEAEINLAQKFEHPESVLPQESSTTGGGSSQKMLTPSEALRQRHQHLQSIHVLATQFGAKVVDVSETCIIVEMSGKTSRVDAFLSLVKPFGIIESARTGTSSSMHMLYSTPLPSLSCSFLWTTLLTCGVINRYYGHAPYTPCSLARRRHLRRRSRCHRRQLTPSRLNVLRIYPSCLLRHSSSWLCPTLQTTICGHLKLS